MKYAVHPGTVRSIADGQLHRVSALQLVKLYRLEPGSWIVWDDEDKRTYYGRTESDYVHLFPKYDGKYSVLDATRLN